MIEQLVAVGREISRLSCQVSAAITISNATRVATVLSRYVIVESRTFVKARQAIEDAAAVVVDEENAQIAFETLIPKCIAVIEEGEIADDAEDLVGRAERVACCNGETSLDTVDTTIAISWSRDSKMLIGPTDGSTIAYKHGRNGKMQEIVHAFVGRL